MTLVNYLRRFFIVALALGLVIGGVACLELYLQQANIDCSSGNHNNAAYKEHPPITPALSQLVPSDYRDQYSAEPKETHYECLIAKYTSELAIFTKVLAYATVFLVLATIGLLVAAFFQSREMKASLRLARDEFVSTHRPHIRVRHLWLDGRFCYGEPPVTAHATVVNDGTSDAVVFEYALGFFVVNPFGSLPVPSQFKATKTLVTLAPGVAWTLDPVEYSISKPDAARLSGDADLFFAGYFLYADGHNRPRTTAFCRKVTYPTRGGSMTVANDPNYEYDD